MLCFTSTHINCTEEEEGEVVGRANFFSTDDGKVLGRTDYPDDTVHPKPGADWKPAKNLGQEVHAQDLQKIDKLQVLQLQHLCQLVRYWL